MPRNIYIASSASGETLKTLGEKVSKAYGKSTPDDEDLIAITDSDNLNIFAKFTWAELKTVLTAAITPTPAAHSLTGGIHTESGLTTGHFLKATGAAAFAFAAHGLAYGDVGAEPANANIQSHISSSSNPHSVTYTQAGAEPANANIQSHIGSSSNPHSVTYTQAGAEPANANIQSHIGSSSNPHSVTYSQAGAEPANANIQSHISAVTGNPHSVTCSDIGAEPVTDVFEADDTNFVVSVIGEVAASGSVTKANTRLSMIDGTAFVWLVGEDISAYAGVAGSSTPYAIEITDGAGKKAYGFLAEEGAGETLGAELLSNPTFDVDTTDWAGVDCTLLAVAGGQSGKCLEITRTGSTLQQGQQTVAAITSMLLKSSAYVKSGTSGNETYYVRCWQAGQDATGTSSAAWVQATFYFTGVATSTLVLRKYTATAGTMLFDEASVKQVTDGPATYSLRVVSTLNGSTQNWANVESGFNANHASGITYRIIDVSKLGDLYIQDGNIRMGTGSVGTGGKGVIAMGLSAVPSTSPTDAIQLYNEAGELKVRDSAGNISPLSPHARTWPLDLVVSDSYPQVHLDENPYLGVRRWIAIGKLAEVVQELAFKAGVLKGKEKLVVYETFEPRKWEDDQRLMYGDPVYGETVEGEVKPVNWAPVPAFIANALAKKKGRDEG